MTFVSSDLLAALPRLRRYARLLIDDPALADEIVKETLSRAQNIRDEAPPAMTPAMRLLSVLRSVYADRVAPRQPRGSMPPQDTASGPKDVRTEEVLTQLFRLPVEQREVLVLVAVERMSYQDIATLLAVPVATVSARLTQAREALRSGAFKSQAAPNGAN